MEKRTPASVALLSSSAADHLLSRRGFLTFSQLLSPFSVQAVDIRDPSTGSVESAEIYLDIRDLRREGYLLSLTVLPYVLHEVLLSENSSAEKALKSFHEAFHRWAEPVDQETLRSYLACIFVVSTADANPLGELSKLIQEQHAQQHGAGEAGWTAPAHCARPVWTTPTTLKHFVIVYETFDEARGRELLSSMSSMYGNENCSELRLSVTGERAEDGLDDIWEEDAIFRRLLEAGLSRATTSLLAKTSSPASAQVLSSLSPSSPIVKGGFAEEGIRTISSDYSFSGSSVSPDAFAIPSPSLPSLPQRRVATQSDRDSCSRLLSRFSRQCLVPHLEKLMRTLLEQLGTRRGISRSLTSGMRKWFGNSQSSSNPGANRISYAAESAEMQGRRLADLALISGLFSFAHQQFQAVKKEFQADQAWLHHSMALEMSALSLRLDNKELTSKQFPVHYLENSLSILLSNGARWPSLLRCARNTSSIFLHLQRFTDAALQLAKLASIDNDMCVGVCEWEAAECFSRAGLYRKTAFYRMLAGHRFGKAGLSALSLAAYENVFREYSGKEWTHAEEHVSSLLAAGSADARLAFECASVLLQRGGQLEVEKAAAYLALYVRTRRRALEGAEGGAPLPSFSLHNIRVIRGERPLSCEADHYSGHAEWNELARAAFQAFSAPSAPFRPVHLLSDDGTENEKIQETPSGERFRVQVELRNPLPVRVILRDLHLGLSEIRLKEEETADSSAQIDISRMEVLELAANKDQSLELWAMPSKQIDFFRVSSIRFLLDSSDGSAPVSCELPLSIKGKRLNKTAKQMKSVEYAVDERLKARVAPSAWPLLDIELDKEPSLSVFSQQKICLNLEITNRGTERVSELALSTDGLDCVSVSEERESGEGVRPVLKTFSRSGLPVFRVHSHGQLQPGQSIRVRVAIRASRESGVQGVSLLLLYRGENGTLREWRRHLRFSVQQLLQANLAVHDSDANVVSLCLRNCLNPSLSALAQVEVSCIRGRLVSRSGSSLTEAGSPIALHPLLAPSNVRLESGQRQRLCFRVHDGDGSPSIHFPAKDNEGIDTEEFTLPLFIPGGGEEIDSNKRKLVISILWSARIVDNDGQTMAVKGESFVSELVGGEGGLKISQQAEFEHSRSRLLASPLPPPSPSDSLSSSAAPLSVSVQDISPVVHDFGKKSICEFGVTVIFRNEDILDRDCSVEISLRPRAREWSSRQQWWLARPVTRRRVAARVAVPVCFGVRVTQPSTYDVLGSQMVATVLVEGEELPRPLLLPAALVVVCAT